ncbi:MAG: hypothetical protein ACPGXL_09685, partial [Chitinophagales bacterium]
MKKTFTILTTFCLIIGGFVLTKALNSDTAELDLFALSEQDDTTNDTNASESFDKMMQVLTHKRC